MPLKPATKLGPFPVGIDNRVRPHEIPSGALCDAVNVDITARGKVQRRKGTRRVLECEGAHSLWGAPGGGRGFFAEFDTLYEVIGDDAVPIATGLVGGRVAYLTVPGRGIAFSDGWSLRRIVRDEVLPFAVPTPQALPAVSASNDGSLPAGYYSVAASWINQAGEESGVCQQVQVYVPDNGAILVSLPGGAPASVTDVNVYMTPTNSETLGLSQTVPIGLAGVKITVATDLGREPTTRFTVPLPAGDLLAYLNGRVYSHRNGLLSYTEAWSGQHSPLKNVIPFPEPVTVLYATPTGLWIVADQTYYLSGEPNAEGSLRARAPVRGVPGSFVESPDAKTAIWFSENGLVMTGEEGGLNFVQQGHVAVLPATEGASLYREQDGIRQVITTTRGAGQSVAAAATWFSASISSGEVRDGFA